MDRNHHVCQSASAGWVALRKESVDRNPENPMIRVNKIPVALRKESVDRNALGGLGGAAPQGVALRKESVDRNYWPDL